MQKVKKIPQRQCVGCREMKDKKSLIRVVRSAEGKVCRVTVPDDQLSLAIGKEGQNARLAARLTGYKIDIKAAGYTGE